MKTLTRLMLLSSLIAGSVAVASADMPGQHPTYVHALSDLREARARLESRAANEKRQAEEENAIRAIDAAIDAAKRAAAEDGKNVNDNPPPDVRLAKGNRFHEALQLLDTARRNVEAKESNPRARDLQGQALAHIDEARHFVEKLQLGHR